MSLRLPAAASIAAASIAAAGVLAGCGQTSGAASTSPAPAAPLATAVTTPDGTWATVPVGDNADPTNVYWQLLYRPAVSGRWVNDVAATATATNGGIDLAATANGVLAGVRPSQNLTFSPLIQTATAGNSWIDGVLPAGLSPTAQALAVATTGAKIGLLGEFGGGQQVVTAASDISHWTAAATTTSLASAAPRCGVAALDAVAYLGSIPLVAAACGTPGVTGLFELAPGRAPQFVPLPVSSNSTATILALSPGVTGLSVLLEVRQGNQVSLRAASSDATLHTWTSSPSLQMGSADLSSVTAEGDGFLVLVKGTGRTSLYTVGRSDLRWRALPAPPPDTTAIAALTQGQMSALSTSGTVITIWDLPAGASSWAKTQTLQVPILYGSSS